MDFPCDQPRTILLRYVHLAVVFFFFFVTYLTIQKQHIDSIVQSSTISPPARRREKIFCDKWIHEGVCAFTQMGCKYKHEMPLDKATQLTLGLNHGIPSWYRRAYAITLRPSSPPMPPMFSPPSNGSRTEGPWRRLEGLPPKMGNNGNHGNSVNQDTYGTSMGGGMQSGPRELTPRQCHTERY